MKEAIYKGELVTVVSVSGGWSTVRAGAADRKLVEGYSFDFFKVRNGQLSDVPATDDGDQDDGIKISRICDTQFRLDRYHSSDIRTKSGRKTLDCHDDVATHLRGLDIEEVYAIASDKTGRAVKALKDRYDHLNVGMQRMNLGNLIRGAISDEKRAAEQAVEKAERDRKLAIQADLRREQKAAAAAAHAEEVALRREQKAIAKAKRDAEREVRKRARIEASVNKARLKEKRRAERAAR